MKLIVTGCEYAGKTTLIKEILKWFKKMYIAPTVHEHFTFPSRPSITRHDMWDPADQEKILRMTPSGRQRINFWGYVDHICQAGWGALYGDVIWEGYYVEDAVYGRAYYGYEEIGTPEHANEFSEFTRDTAVSPGMKHVPRVHSAGGPRCLESMIMSVAPETILLLMEASPNIIEQRMKETPHEPQRIKKSDISTLVEEFREEVKNSLIAQKMILDTSKVTVEETFEQFRRDVTQYLTEKDMLRIVLHGIRTGKPL